MLSQILSPFLNSISPRAVLWKHSHAQFLVVCSSGKLALSCCRLPPPSCSACSLLQPALLLTLQIPSFTLQPARIVFPVPVVTLPKGPVYWTVSFLSNYFCGWILHWALYLHIPLTSKQKVLCLLLETVSRRSSTNNCQIKKKCMVVKLFIASKDLAFNTYWWCAFYLETLKYGVWLAWKCGVEAVWNSSRTHPGERCF